MRKYYLDNLRGFTVLVTVIYHIIYMFNTAIPTGAAENINAVQYQDGILYLIYPWFMALLFIISGICAREYLSKHSISEFIKARTLKLLIPSTLGVIVLHWIQGIVNMALVGAFDTMPENVPLFVKYIIAVLSGTGVLWFIRLLWIYSVLLALIRKFEQGKIKPVLPFYLMLALILPAWGSAQILNIPVVSVYRCGIYFFMFLTGYFIFSQEENIDRLINKRYILYFITVILAVFSLKCFFGKNYAEKPVVNSIISAAYCQCACMSILATGKKYFYTENYFTRFMYKYGWGIYIFHYFPLSLSALILKGKLPVFALYVICGILSFGGSVLIYKLVLHIPVLRFFALGIKSNNKRK